jgi:hypothetical protein
VGISGTGELQPGGLSESGSRPIWAAIPGRLRAACGSRLALAGLGAGLVRGWSRGDDPLHGLAGDGSDEVVVAVVAQHGDALSFGDGCDQQVGGMVAGLARGLVRRPVAWAARSARMALRQKLVVMVLLR